MSSLWPDGFQERKIRTPNEILEEQGKYLPKLTGDLVHASIETVSQVDPIVWVGDLKGDFIYSFSIKGKLVPKYRYIILYFAYNVEIYPLKIFLHDDQIVKELQIENRLNINNEDEFITVVKQIFNSERLKHVIGSILTLSK